MKKTMFHKNDVIVLGDKIIIILRNRKQEIVGETIIDRKNYNKIIKHKWHKTTNGYAQTNINGKSVFMHSLVLKRRGGFQLDHKNRNKLDNTEKNLRYATHQQNVFNRDVVGVRFRKDCNKWEARITINGKYKHIGLFKEKDAAISHRKRLAKKYHKKFFAT